MIIIRVQANYQMRLTWDGIGEMVEFRIHDI